MITNKDWKTIWTKLWTLIKSITGDVDVKEKGTIQAQLNNKAETNGSNATGDWNINITGNSKTATKATQDGNGKEISKTYLPLAGGTMEDDAEIKALNGRLDIAEIVGTGTNYGTSIEGIIRNKVFEIDLTDTTIYDKDKYYPVVGSIIQRHVGLIHIKATASLAYSGVPSWSTHAKGFHALLELLVLGDYYSEQYPKSICLCHTCRHTYNELNPLGYSQLRRDGRPVFWLRGGGKYKLYADYNCKWTIYTELTYFYGESVEPTTTNPGVSLAKSTVYANLYGNSETATNLKNTYTKDTRPTSANVDATTNLNLVSYMLATSVMTEGKPCFDGHILTFNWDGTIGSGAQLFLPNNPGYNAQFRGCISSDWEDWKTFLDSNNYSNYAIPLTGTTALAGNIIPKSTSYQLGSDTYPFSQGYFTTAYVKSGLYSLYHYIRDSVGNIQGRLEGNSTTATMYSSAGDSTSDTIGADLFGTTNLRLRAGSRVYLSANTSISASRGISIASDAKIKEFTDDIEQDKKALIKLFDIIQIKTYRYRYSDKNKLTLGFSAQDVEKACNEMGVDPEKYGILNIMYNHYMYRGDDDEDIKFYTKFYEISYNDLYNLALLKIQSMEKEHKEILEEHNNRIKALEEKLL